MKISKFSLECVYKISQSPLSSILSCQQFSNAASNFSEHFRTKKYVIYQN